MVDQQDAVAHRDAEQGDEADHARDRDHRRGVVPAEAEQRQGVGNHPRGLGQVDRHDAADQGERQVHQHQQHHPERPDRELEEQGHEQHHQPAEDQDRAAGVLLRLELPAVVHGVAMPLHDRVDELPHLADQVAEVVSLLDVQGHHRLALGVLAGDEVRGHLRSDVGHLVQADQRTALAAQHEVLQVTQVVALRVVEPHAPGRSGGRPR